MRHSVLNAEAFTAVSFLLILLLRSRRRPVTVAPELRIRDAVLCGGVALVVLGAFWPALSMPLLHDSYGHVYTAARESISDVLGQFVTHPQHGDFFFRPLGYLSFWLDSRWAGESPFRWHAWSVAVHLLNSVLVYTLARRVRFSKLGAFTGAMVFDLHGSRPEAVAWVAARFDLLAAFFSLLALHSALAYASSEKRAWLGPVAVFTAAALLCKESAYCLPLLVAGILLLRWRTRRIVPPITVVLGVSGMLFLYRTWVLRGVGGYGAESGSPEVLRFSLVKSLHALFFREWALLLFPVNWSVTPGLALWLGLAAGLGTLLLVLVFARGPSWRFALPLAIVFAASLPVVHLLLIGSDLSGARVLYLPVLGMALFWGFAVESVRKRWARYAVCALLSCFQLAALEHNLAIWSAVARISQQTCASLADQVAQNDGEIAVLDPPAKLKGVFFLKNSLPACILLNSRGKLTTLPHVISDSASAMRVYRWNPATERLEEQR